MTPVSHGKPCAGNPHARFDEGASASEEPRRNALLHKTDVQGRKILQMNALRMETKVRMSVIRVCRRLMFVIQRLEVQINVHLLSLTTMLVLQQVRQLMTSARPGIRTEIIARQGEV